jgi:hypothetical protein
MVSSHAAAGRPITRNGLPHGAAKAAEAAAPEATQATPPPPHSGHADARLRADARGAMATFAQRAGGGSRPWRRRRRSLAHRIG